MFSITNVVRGLFARSAAPQRPRRVPRRLQLECLEERTLLCNPGELDLSFDTDGIAMTDVSGFSDDAYAVAVQSDGKIVAAGAANNGIGASWGLVRYNAAGSLDTSFGAGGKVITDSVKLSGYTVRDVVIQTDGKLVAVGQSNSTSDFAVVRYNSNGTLDKNFGAGGAKGIVLTSFGSSAVARAVALQPNGRIVVTGAAAGGFAVARYNSNGTLDTSFDGDGKVVTDVHPGGDVAKAVAVQTDGKIVVAGDAGQFALVRYNSNGSLDSSFGSGGRVLTQISTLGEQFGSMVLQADGQIVVVGTIDLDNWGPNPGASPDTSIVLLRYNGLNGSLDSSFGIGGVVKTNIGTGRDNGGDYADAVAVQPDGKIVVGGHTAPVFYYDFLLVRYNPDGSLDTSFDSDGIVTTAISSGNDVARDIAIQPARSSQPGL